MMILVLVLVIAVVYYNSGERKLQNFNNNVKSPEALLKERFATGEIDEATYLNMKEVISK